MRMNKGLPFAAFALAASVAMPVTASAMDHLKYGMLRVPQAVLVGISKGFFKEKGIEVEPVIFQSGAQIVPAVSTGQVDLAATSPGAALYNALAQGVKAKIVADYFVPGPNQPGGDPNAIAVRKDLIDSGKFKTPADAKGMTIAITARGQFTDLFARKFLQLGGLTEKDVRIVNMPYPDMLAALKGNAIELAAGIDPSLYRAVQEGIAVRYKKLSEVLPGLNLGVIMYGDRLTDKDRNLGMRFMAAYQKSNTYLRHRLTEPDGRKEIAQIYQKYLPLPDPSLYEKIGLGMGNEKLMVNVDGDYGLRWQLEQHIASGLVPNPPDLKTIVDNSFAEAAAKGK
jgi:NitT/TauT family transport system substrate-binding protein